MKYLNLTFLILICFCNTSSVKSQSLKPPTDHKNITITMKHYASIVTGWSYTVTINGKGTVVYKGTYDGRAIPYEEPRRVIRKYRIAQKQFKELVDEFYKIDFFSLDDSYAVQINKDGSKTIMYDSGVEGDLISISVGGKTKSVENFNFAPESLMILQRKIYELSNIHRFVRTSPYWSKVLSIAAPVKKIS